MSIFYTKYSLKKLTFKSDLNLQQLQSCRLQNSSLQSSLLVSLKSPDYHKLGLLLHLFFFSIYVFLKFISEHHKLCVQSCPSFPNLNLTTWWWKSYLYFLFYLKTHIFWFMFLTLNIYCIPHKLQNVLLILQYHREGKYSLLGSLAGQKIELTQDRLTGKKLAYFILREYHKMWDPKASRAIEVGMPSVLRSGLGAWGFKREEDKGKWFLGRSG